VTRKRAGAPVAPSYVPNARMVESYGSKFGWKAKSLATVLSAFGPLSDAGQDQLIGCLYLAFGRNQLAAKTTKRVTPSEQRDQLTAIQTTAQKLLRQLGINAEAVATRFMWERLSDRPPMERVHSLGKQTPDALMVTAWLSQAGIDTSNSDADSVNSELRKASDDVANSIIALLSLHARAKTAAQAVTTRVAPGLGGTRHRPQAIGQLIRDIIEIYAHVRAQHPGSGNKPGFGEPLLKFVRAVAALFGARITDTQNGEVWRQRESNLK
jgi:hypothetical protein